MNDSGAILGGDWRSATHGGLTACGDGCRLLYGAFFLPILDVAVVERSEPTGQCLYLYAGGLLPSTPAAG